MLVSTMSFSLSSILQYPEERQIELAVLVFSSFHIGRLARMSVFDTEVDGSNPGSSMLFP